MHQRAQRASVDHQPSDKRTELRRRHDVDLEHADRVRADGFVPDAVSAQFWELVADAGPQCVREGGLRLVVL